MPGRSAFSTQTPSTRRRAPQTSSAHCPRSARVSGGENNHLPLLLLLLLRIPSSFLLLFSFLSLPPSRALPPNGTTIHPCPWWTDYAVVVVEYGISTLCCCCPPNLPSPLCSEKGRHCAYSGGPPLKPWGSFHFFLAGGGTGDRRMGLTSQAAGTARHSNAFTFQ